MLEEKKILEYKKRYTETSGGIYANTRTEQEKDKEYIDDTFLPKIRHPHKVLRLGLGEEIVNSPAEQIVTSNPQAFVEAGNKDAALRISKVINGWIEVLRRQNPQPFKESVKNKLARGENYIKVVHNEAWVTKPISKDKKGLPVFDRRGLPVLFVMLDPMVIYGSPEEDEDGVPMRVLVDYPRQTWDVIVKYPNWGDPKNTMDGRLQQTEWFEFIDRDTMYASADGKVVVHKPNPYKTALFTRRYSGLGRRSPDGELSSLIVGDIRNSRGLIEEICVMRSDIASVMHLSAHKPKLATSTGEINTAALKELRLDSYDISVLDHLPPDFKLEDIVVDQPPQEAFAHVANCMADITRRHPYIMAGFPMGSSGRQQDSASIAAMKRYDTVVENTETEWGTIFEKAFKIMKEIPTLLPEGLHQGDLDVDFRCTVKLKAKDPIEEDRLITLGDRLRRLPNPAIDLGTFHREFLGYTENKSKEVKAKMLADMVTINNPQWAQVMGMVAAEEGAMTDWLEEVAEQQAAQPAQIPATTQERAQGEGGPGSPTEGTRGARRSPERATRGE